MGYSTRVSHAFDFFSLVDRVLRPSYPDFNHYSDLARYGILNYYFSLFGIFWCPWKSFIYYKSYKYRVVYVGIRFTRISGRRFRCGRKRHFQNVIISFIFFVNLREIEKSVFGALFLRFRRFLSSVAKVGNTEISKSQNPLDEGKRSSHAILVKCQMAGWAVFSLAG